MVGAIDQDSEKSTPNLSDRTTDVNVQWEIQIVELGDILHNLKFTYPQNKQVF